MVTLPSVPAKEEEDPAAVEVTETPNREDGTNPDPNADETVIDSDTNPTLVEDGKDGVAAKPSFFLREIPKEKDQHKWQLPEELATFVTKYTKEHCPDSDIQAWIENYPPPSNIQGAPVLDCTLRKALKDDGKSSVIDADDDFLQIQRKIQEVLGPLGVAWAQLEMCVSGQSKDPIDAVELADRLQKSVVLIAHVIQKVSWFRRVHVLSAIGKVKDVRELLKRENIQKIFEKNTSHELFSKEFHNEVQLENKSKPNIMDLFKPKKKKETSASASKAATSSPKFLPAGSKRPFSSNPFPRGGGSRYHDGYRSRNPFSSYNNSSSYQHQYGGRNDSRGNYSKIVMRQHASTSNMALESSTCTSINNGNFSDHGSNLPFGRKNSKILGKLGTPDKRQKCLEHCQGLGGSSDLNSCSKENSDRSEYESNRRESHGHGDRKHVDERRNQGGNSEARPVSEQRVCNSERGGTISSNNKPERIESVRPIPPFQNGGSEGCEKPVTERGLDVQIRSQGCVFFGSPQYSLSETGQVSLERNSLRVPLSGIRSRSGPKDFHKIDESSHFNSQEARGVPGDLFGRPINNGVVNRGVGPCTGHNNVSIPSFGVNHKSKKVGSGSFTGDGISRRASRQLKPHVRLTGSENPKLDFEMSRSSELPTDVPAEPLFPDRKAEGRGQ